MSTLERYCNISTALVERMCAETGAGGAALGREILEEHYVVQEREKGEEFNSKLVGQIENLNLVTFIDDKVSAGMTRFAACRLWANKEGCSPYTVMTRYSRMKKRPVRQDGRCRKHGITDQDILAAIFHFADMGNPLSFDAVKHIAYYDNPEALPRTKAKWLRRFRNTYADILTCQDAEQLILPSCSMNDLPDNYASLRMRIIVFRSTTESSDWRLPISYK